MKKKIFFRNYLDNNNNNSSNFYQAFWLGIGQIGVFGLTFLSAAILSRYLSKEDYGIYRQVLYVYITLMSVFTIGLPSVFTFFIPRLNPNQQKTLVKTLNKVFIILGLLFSLTIYFFAGYIAHILKNPELETGLKIFSPFPLFTFPTLGVEGIYTALRKTKQVALYQIFSRFVMLIFTVIPVIFINNNYSSAVIGWGIASFLTFLVAMYMKNRPYVNCVLEEIPNMKSTILNYSLPLMGAFFAGYFISSADQFYISRYYGTETFADYSNGSMSIPIVAIIAISIKKVLLPIFSKAHADDKLSEAIATYVSAVNKSIIIVFPIVVFFIMNANVFMTLIYGELYYTSGYFLRYHLLRDFLEVLPYFSVFLALGLSRIYLYMHIAGVFFVWIFGYIVVSLDMDATMIVLVRSVYYILSTIFAMIYLNKKLNINLMPIEITIQLVKVLLHSILCGFIVYQFSLLFNLNELNNILMISITISIYYIILIFSGKIIKLNYLGSVLMLLKK